MQLPGGCLALKLGGTRIFGYAIFLASMLTLLTPVATRYSVYGMIAVRAGEGLMLVRNTMICLLMLHSTDSIRPLLIARLTNERHRNIPRSKFDFKV